MRRSYGRDVHRTPRQLYLPDSKRAPAPAASRRRPRTPRSAELPQAPRREPMSLKEQSVLACDNDLPAETGPSGALGAALPPPRPRPSMKDCHNERQVQTCISSTSSRHQISEEGRQQRERKHCPHHKCLAQQSMPAESKTRGGKQGRGQEKWGTISGSTAQGGRSREGTGRGKF